MSKTVRLGIVLSILAAAGWLIWQGVMWRDAWVTIDKRQESCEVVKRAVGSQPMEPVPVEQGHLTASEFQESIRLTRAVNEETLRARSMDCSAPSREARRRLYSLLTDDLLAYLVLPLIGFWMFGFVAFKASKWVRQGESW